MNISAVDSGAVDTLRPLRASHRRKAIDLHGSPSLTLRWSSRMPSSLAGRRERRLDWRHRQRVVASSKAEGHRSTSPASRWHVTFGPIAGSPHRS